MNRLNHNSLQRLVDESGALPTGLILMIGEKLCSALEEFRTSRGTDGQSLVHRDIKPENVLIGSHGEVELIDPGLAVLCNDGGAEGSQPMEPSVGFCGSKLFASREQQLERVLDHRSDLYSLGMTLWFLASGGRPKSFEKLSEVEVQIKHMSEEPFDFSGVDQVLAPVLTCLLARLPKHRFQMAEEARAAFNDSLGEYYSDGRERPTFELLLQNLSPKLQNKLKREALTLEEELWIVSKTDWVSDIGSSYFVASVNDPNHEVVAIATIIQRLSGTSSQQDTMRAHLTSSIDKYCELRKSGDYPSALLSPFGIRWFNDDQLAIIAEAYPKEACFTLQQLIRHRGRIDFSDLIQSDIASRLAEALDFLDFHDLPTPGLFEASVFFVFRDEIADAESLIGQEFSEWGQFEVKFMPICFSENLKSISSQSAEENLDATEFLMGTVDAMGSGTQTVSRNPVATFAACLYFMIGGLNVAEIAFSFPEGYTNVRGLGPSGNELLRTAISHPRSNKAAGCMQLLDLLCEEEGIAPAGR